MKFRRLLWLVLLLGSVALDARAQVCSAEAQLRRTLPVNVLDEQGNLVRGLTAADFRASFRGHPVKILSVEHNMTPGRVVVLLDAERRMQATASKWNLALVAVGDIASRLPKQVPMALVVFDGYEHETLGFTDGREAIQRKVVQLASPPPWQYRGVPQAPLMQAVEAGLRLLDAGTAGDVIYVVTDGRQMGFEEDPRMGLVERTLLGSAVRLFATRFGVSEGLAVFASGRLEELVKTTGGNTVLFESTGGTVDADEYRYGAEESAAVAARASRLYEQMLESYRAGVGLPQAADKARGWKLEVVDSRGKRRKDVEVTYPRKLVPCTAAPTP